MRGSRHDDVSVNGGWILKSGVSIRMTLVNLSPEPRILGSPRTRHPLRKEKRRRCFYFHSRTHFQEEFQVSHPGREGFGHAIHNFLCSAREIGQQSERRMGLQITMGKLRLPRSKESSVNNIEMPTPE